MSSDPDVQDIVPKINDGDIFNKKNGEHINVGVSSLPDGVCLA
jgi:hypothetical protein